MDLVLRMRFLGGRIYARGEGGIPDLPEPARLFAALVHAWGTGGRNSEEEALLQRLEGLPPPRIFAPQLGEPVRYGSYTYPNEPEKGGLRTQKALALVTVRPLLGEPVVHFHYQGAEALDLEVLDRLLARVSRFGSSRNPVLLERVEGGGPFPGNAYEAAGDGGIPVRVHYPGFFAALEERFQKGLPALPARHALYRPIPRPGPRGPYRLEEPFVLALRPGLPLSYWPRLQEAVRARLGGLGNLPLVPLAFVGRPWADGRILGVALLVPEEEGRGGLAQALWGALGKFPFGPWRLRLELPRRERETLDPQRWAGSARRWASLTPLPPERVEAALEDLVRRGYPSPAWRAVPHSPLGGVPPAREFGPEMRHLVLEFDEPVPGPLLLGGVEGMGFLAPWREGSEDGTEG